MSALDEAGQPRYVSFTTFRRTGVPVATPVWIARDGDELCFMTNDNVGKTKRLKNNPACEMRPCSMRGEVEPDAPVWRGTATVHRDEATQRRVRAAIARKYPEGRLGNAVVGLLMRVGVLKTPRAAILIRLDEG